MPQKRQKTHTSRNTWWVKTIIKKLTTTIEELKKSNQELKNIAREEQKLKLVMLAWLKDHHVRLGLHWDEIIRRTIK